MNYETLPKTECVFCFYNKVVCRLPLFLLFFCSLMSVVGVQRQYLGPPARLQIQLTADSRVQWKQSEIERKV